MNSKTTQLQACCAALAAVCDGAIALDGHGFAASDVAVGHFLGETPAEFWNDEMTFKAWQLLQKYVEQLDAYGHDLRAIGEPEGYQQWRADRYNNWEQKRAAQDRQRAAKMTATWTDFIAKLPFSEPKRVNTRNGEMLVSNWKPATSEELDLFFGYWKANKSAMKAAGYSVGKDEYNGGWRVARWMRPEGAEPPVEQSPVPMFEEELPGQIAAKLFPYQLTGARHLAHILRTRGAALDASDTGVGKTFMAIAACAKNGYTPLVVCPLAVVPSWQQAFAHFGVNGYVSNYESYKLGKTPYCTPVEGRAGRVEFSWTVPPNCVVIFDEAHKLKDSKTQNCRLALAVRDAKVRCICLSATIADNPMQMKATGSIIGLFPPSMFFPWCLDHGVMKGRFGMEFRGGLHTIQRIHREIFPDHGNRTRIADLGDAFPATLICAEAYKLNGEINSVYERMAEEIARLNAQKEMDARSRNACILTEILRARQEAELLKAPALAEMTEDAIEEGNSVAIFVNFKETMEALCRLLKTDCVVRGGQTIEEREANRQRFQRDESRVIICNIKAGGVGISLHDLHGQHPRLSLICPTYSAQDLKQALGRVQRGGGQTPSVQRIIYAADTIEEKACRAARRKLDHIETLNDGDVQEGFPTINP